MRSRGREHQERNGPEQLELLPAVAVPAEATPQFPPGTCDTNPVAQVLVDLPIAHLGREFDYAVPKSMDDQALPGVRIKVRFAGKERDGFIVGRTALSEHSGTLQSIRRVVSAVPVLTPQILALCQHLAVRNAGTVMDLVRLALPPRHAGTEKRWLERLDGLGTTPPPVDAVLHSPDDLWSPYQGGDAFLARLAAGASPWAIWTALAANGDVPFTAGGWAETLVAAAVATAKSGRRTLIIVPDQRDLAIIEDGLGNAGYLSSSSRKNETNDGAPRYARLTAEDPASTRYGSFLAALSGSVSVVIGTRSAAYAPIPNLGLIACWDDGDDLFDEPRTPYVHTRDVLTARAQLEQAALCLGAFARSTPAQLLIASGQAQPVVAERAVIRARTPRISWFDDVDRGREGPAGAARLPGAAMRLIREGLERGPVLVQVPRGGYLPAIACATCRTIASCRNCHGPLALLAASQIPRCQWCGTLEPAFECPECRGTNLRSIRTGSVRTAEELGRAFPSARIVSSTAFGDGRVHATVPPEPALVIATPGAEPAVTNGNYAAAVLLDAAILTARASMRAGEEALRRWINAAALVRHQSQHGAVLLVGDGAGRPIQALVRWDPAGFAERELAERSELHLPPAIGCASLTGGAAALRQLLGHAQLPEPTEVLGPVPAPPSRVADVSNDPRQAMIDTEDDLSRIILRCPLDKQSELAAALQHAQGIRAARKERGSIRIEVNPQELL